MVRAREAVGIAGCRACGVAREGCERSAARQRRRARPRLATRRRAQGSAPAFPRSEEAAQSGTARRASRPARARRSEEHTSELQSPCNLVCRLLLEKKKKNRRTR